MAGVACTHSAAPNPCTRTATGRAKISRRSYFSSKQEKEPEAEPAKDFAGSLRRIEMLEVPSMRVHRLAAVPIAVLILSIQQASAAAPTTPITPTAARPVFAGTVATTAAPQAARLQNEQLNPFAGETRVR